MAIEVVLVVADDSKSRKLGRDLLTFKGGGPRCNRPALDRRRFLLTSLAGAFAVPPAPGAQQTFSGSCQASLF